MHEGMIQLVPQTCTTCGYGPVRPQTNTTHDQYAHETLVEATWVCSRCGSRFASGIVERIPDEKKD